MTTFVAITHIIIFQYTEPQSFGKNCFLEHVPVCILFAVVLQNGEASVEAEVCEFSQES